MMSPDGLLLAPRLHDPGLALGPDALQRPKPFRRPFDDVEHLRAERLHQLAREVRADALDEARAQVLLDSFEGGRRDDPQRLGAELDAVGGVVHPGAAAIDLFARADRGGAAHHGRQLPAAPDLDLQDAEAGVLAVEGDTLHQPLQAFFRVFGRLGCHGRDPSRNKRILRLRFATLRMNGGLRFATLRTNGGIVQGFAMHRGSKVTNWRSFPRAGAYANPRSATALQSSRRTSSADSARGRGHHPRWGVTSSARRSRCSISSKAGLSNRWRAPQRTTSFSRSMTSWRPPQMHTRAPRSALR